MSQADGRQMPENYTDRMNTTVAPVTELSPREYHGDSSSTGPYPGGTGEQLSGLIHDARNMVSALELYCDLLEEPGVLFPGAFCVWMFAGIGRIWSLYGAVNVAHHTRGSSP